MNWMSALGLESLSARVRARLNEGAIAVEDRVALARLEWTAQKQRLQTLVVLGILLGGLTIVAMVLLSLAILIHFWDAPERTTVAWVIAGIWVVAWGAVLAALVCTLRKSSQPFALSRAELARDWAQFKDKL